MEAILAGARSSFLPIAMTILASIADSSPRGWCSSEEARPNQWLALAVVGGLTWSTILSLFRCPAMFLLFAKRTAAVDLVKAEAAAAIHAIEMGRRERRNITSLSLRA